MSWFFTLTIRASWKLTACVCIYQEAAIRKGAAHDFDYGSPPEPRLSKVFGICRGGIQSNRPIFRQVIQVNRDTDYTIASQAKSIVSFSALEIDRAVFFGSSEQ